MKKVVGGKLWDTDVSMEIASKSGAGVPGVQSDFRWYRETLYRAPCGGYFVAGEGGPMTRWKRCVGQNSWTSGTGVQVLDVAGVLQWLDGIDFDDVSIDEAPEIAIALGLVSRERMA